MQLKFDAAYVFSVRTSQLLVLVSIAIRHFTTMSDRTLSCCGLYMRKPNTEYVRIPRILPEKQYTEGLDRIHIRTSHSRCLTFSFDIHKIFCNFSLAFFFLCIVFCSLKKILLVDYVASLNCRRDYLNLNALPGSYEEDNTGAWRITPR